MFNFGLKSDLRQIAHHPRYIEIYVDSAYYIYWAVENTCSQWPILALVCSKLYVDTISLSEVVTFPSVIDTD